eukprot:gene27068-35782_t
MSNSSESQKIPIERFVCNLIDDVPAPPVMGNVDVLYYINDTAMSFRCPALNAPHIWPEGSTLPLFPLFECLSPENVCAVLSLLLTERQVILVSSQLSLLTLTCEAILSLMYPLTWSHAYIPVLPYPLLGVLGAPVPFLIGLHTEIYPIAMKDHLTTETYRVLLDDNVILFGSGGPPIPLPERRLKKLLAHIHTAAPIFDRTRTLLQTSNSADHLLSESEILSEPNLTEKSEDDSKISVSKTASGSIVNIFNHSTDKSVPWKYRRLPYFDIAKSSVSENIHSSFSDLLSEESIKKDAISVNERSLREGFLKFFVAILKDYKKYLIYGTPEDPDPIVKFKFSEFISDQAAEFRPFLQVMVETQAFSQFVDERVLHLKKNQDVVFFDESIDAKMNRYLLRKILKQTTDTPFLNDTNVKVHIKTYVPPSPDLSNLPYDAVYSYNQRFPRLDPALFAKPRNMKAKFSETDRRLDQIRFKAIQQRNKQASTLALKTVFEVSLSGGGVCGEPQSLIDLIVYMDDEGLAPDQHILHALAKALTTARAMAEEEEVDQEKMQANSSSQLQADFLAIYMPPSAEKKNIREVGKPAVDGPSSKKIPISQLLNPAAVWTVSNWRRYCNPTTCSLYLRKSFSAASEPGANQNSNHAHGRGSSSSSLAASPGDDSIVVRLLFGEDHSNRNQKNLPQQSHPTQTSHSSNNNSTINNHNNHSVQQASGTIPSDYWSIKFPREGEVPKLKWCFQSEIHQHIPTGDSKLLNPWVLMKEILNILYLSCDLQAGN